jgi:hypothetical protein
MKRPPVRTRSCSGGPIASALAVAALVALGVIGSGSPSERRTALTLDATAQRFHVTEVTPTTARVSRAASVWSGGPMTTSTGETVTVYVSAALPVELGTAQTWAEFLVELVHGPELAALTAYIAPLVEVQEICGPRALGCYGGNRLVAMGETMFGITAAEIVRHEYGHHVAGNRLNPPWAAIDWGPKNWASSANICRRAADGSAYPGDEGDRYTLNPGEAWAETYRLMSEAKSGALGSGWQLVDPSFQPDEVALQAAELDVLEPWTVASKTAFRHRFTAKGKRVWSVPIATPLDGDLKITINLPKQGLHDAVLFDRERGRILATGLWAGTSAKRITKTVCGTRSLVLKVSQRGAYGRVVAVVEKP